MIDEGAPVRAGASRSTGGHETLDESGQRE